MIFKINKCSKPYWWYKNSVGEEFEIDLKDCYIEHDGPDTFIWCDFKINNIISSRGVLLEDSNYNIIIRKQKLNKINLT